MTSKIFIFNNQVCFSYSTDLEKYRIESLEAKEPETIAWIDDWSVSRGAAVFFDIGANIGVYSVYASYRHDPLQVYAFEPVSMNYTALQNNASLNPSAKVYPLNVAIAHEVRLTELYLSDDRVGNSGAQIGLPVNEIGEVFAPVRIEKVLSVSLDRLVYEFGLPMPNFIKVDVDGHEGDVLNGMSRILSEPAVRSILIEFNDEEEFAYWSPRLSDVGLFLDTRFDDIPNHSRLRRACKGALARNYIFSRK
jgi:FkbM family methyltransferase